MGSIRVVYDTNVLVSGIGFGGTPWRCLFHVFMGDVDLLVSEAILDEFQRVMGYDRLPFTEEERDRFPSLLEAEAMVVDPEIDIRAIDDDPDDDMFIECAVAGDADFVVSGDRHLTELGTVRDVPIVDPALFLSIIEGEP